MLISLIVLTLTGCHAGSMSGRDSAPLNYAAISPESLMDITEERVTVSLYDRSSVSDMKQWIEQDLPTRAELSCEGTSNCKAAQKVLSSFSIPFETMEEADGKHYEPAVILFYNRILARDCQCGYELRNGHKIPVVGCAHSVNMMQMVSDRQQFHQPEMMGMTDTHHGVNAIHSQWSH